MKHLKLFEEFNQDLNEGQIQVYPPGNPYKAEGSMTWPGIHTWLPKYKAEGRGIIVGADFDYDKFIADPKYRSIPLGTWKDKTLPKFLDSNPRYDEVEYDYIEIVPNPEKETREPWVKIADKNGIEFMIPPFAIMDIIKGGSVQQKIFPGETFLIDNMRAKIADFINGKVIVKIQDGSTKEFTPQEWKSRNFMPLEERATAGIRKRS